MPADKLADPAQRVVLLDRHRRLVIRPVRPDDARPLESLYDRLSLEDRHRRFFCAYRPPPEWFDDLAVVEAPASARLVAEVVSATGTVLVAEAGYTTTPNGNGDVAVTVDRPWRGWLGPVLLDRLADVAAGNGVPNLEADVLTTNGPMLALLRHRGAVILEHDGWRTLRLRIGTGGRSPTWDGSGGGRLLVEAPGGRWPGEEEALAAGLAVVTCPGPGPRRRCPALDGEPCALAAGADAVVVRSPPGDDRWVALVAAHRVQHPQAALLLEQISSHTDRAAEAIARLSGA